MATRRAFELCGIFDLECCLPTKEDIIEIDLLCQHINSGDRGKKHGKIQKHSQSNGEHLVLEYVSSLVKLAYCFPQIKIVLYLHHGNRELQEEIEKAIQRYKSTHDLGDVQLVDLIVSTQALFHHIGVLQIICEETRIFTRNKSFYQPGFIEHKKSINELGIRSGNSFVQGVPMVNPLHKAPRVLTDKIETFNDPDEEIKHQGVYEVLLNLKQKIDALKIPEEAEKSSNNAKEEKEIDIAKSVLDSTEISVGEQHKIDDISESRLTFSSEATFITKSSRQSPDKDEAQSQDFELDTIPEGVDIGKKAPIEESKSFSKYNFNNEFYQESTMNFICKLYSHFKNKFNQESVSFINSLDNLVAQHLIKISKKADHAIEEDEKLKYFVYIRNKLYVEKFVKGTLYEFWTKHNINTLHAMNESTKLTVDIQKLEEVYQKFGLDKGQKKESAKSGKKFALITDVSLYASICYTIIKTMSDKHFYHEYGSETNYKKYMKVIENLLKNMYNSKSLEQNQRDLLKRDKSIRYLHMKLLENFGVFKVKSNKKLEFCESALEQFSNNMKKYPRKDLIKMLKIEIQNLDGLLLN
ncbi:unnamed protein product [Moneuplotes crassus]|uniref:Uncharacterized protein n=1 Tax=Euplotes crassus TaxID=5936 RepID=A0AAD1UB66_EUPCR|nr:unnamed protein product [Moneuplotes crassus]